MLVLKSFEGTKYNLTTKSEHIVGRLGSDLIINDDDSISRKHASLRISVKRGKLHAELSDTGSKHGTFVNEGIEQSNAIPKHSTISLNVKDRIRFGLRLSIWTLEEEPFVICMPSVTTQRESLMNELFTKVRGSIVSTWSKRCTHLTVNEIRIETKVVCALAYSRPIVTFDYWVQLLTALTSRKEQPLQNYTDFIPVVDNALRCLGQLNFDVNPARRVLFRNQQFIAFDKEQLETFLPIVEAAGGKIKDVTTAKLSLEQLTSKNIIVLQAKSDRNKKEMETCLNLLKKQKKRAVPETEICLSIIYASKDQFCNPSYDVKTLFKYNETLITMSDDTVLVDDSQDISEAPTQIQGLGSGSNFSLAINDPNRAFDDVDDNFVVPNSPPIIEEPRTTRSGLKRKLEGSPAEPAVKNTKLDSATTDQKNDDKTDCSEPKLSRTRSFSKEDMSCFQSSIRTSGRSSRSLFAGVKNRVIPNSNILPEKNTENSSSLIPDSLKRSTGENTSEPPSRRSSRNLFAKSHIESADTSSTSLFSSRAENSPMLGKRKASELSDLEPGTSTSKQSKRSSTLFESTQPKRRGKVIAVDFGDEMDSPMNLDPSNLTISRTLTKRNVLLPTIQVPTTVNLNDFMEAHKPETKIKQEPDLDISSEIKDMLDKTVLHSVSLIKAKPRDEAVVSERNNVSGPNFKKFRKNPCSKPSSIVPITSLVLFKPNVKNEM